jgi:hypothetical protein
MWRGQETLVRRGLTPDTSPLQGEGRKNGSPMTGVAGVRFSSLNDMNDWGLNSNCAGGSEVPSNGKATEVIVIPTSR